MKTYSVGLVLVIGISLWSTNALAWKCHHRCPTSVFSGSLECKAWKEMNCGGGGSSNAPGGGSNSTVCVYNNSGMKLNYTVDWDTCLDSTGNLQNNYSMTHTCPNSDTGSLVLQWSGYQADLFRFGRASGDGQCNDDNSLTILPSKFGYQFNVKGGKP